MSKPRTSGGRYQSGTFEKKNTAQGPCWYLRFRVQDADGRVTRPRVRVGLVRDFATKAALQRSADTLRAQFNEIGALPQAAHTMQELIDRYQREEMPERYSTAKGYRNLLDKHIGPKWGARKVTEMRASEMRDWLRVLKLSPKSRGHVRDMLRTLFRFAMLWEWIPLSENPMSLFRLEKSGQRTKQPRVFTPEEFGKLMEHPSMQREPVRTLTLLAAGLGLRCSELFGLRWSDVDWDRGLLRVERGIVDGNVDEVKTVQSRKPLPLHDNLAVVLRRYQKQTEFKAQTDFIFASPHTAGEKPYDPKYMQYYVLAKAARESGLGTGVGWHTFRHSYRAWLGRVGAEVGVQKDLMRHAQISTTMNVYGDSFVDRLREANEGVVKMVIN